MFNRTQSIPFQNNGTIKGETVEHGDRADPSRQEQDHHSRRRPGRNGVRLQHPDERKAYFRGAPKIAAGRGRNRNRVLTVIERLQRRGSRRCHGGQAERGDDGSAARQRVPEERED